MAMTYNVCLFVIIFEIMTLCHVAICQNNYCSFGSSHTMCRYPEGSGCSKLQRGVNSAAIQDIVSAHNRLRQKVANGQERNQPSASNMKEMVWDSELATIAQRWADQCSFGHDTNRVSFRFSKFVGQNVAYTGGSSSDCTPEFSRRAITMWYNEVSQFSPQSIDPFRFSGGTGHYTQIAWADTYAIGCGYACYRSGGSVQKYYVCNYGPGGNMVGGSMYKVGQPCTACSGSSCSGTYPGLCATSAVRNKDFVYDANFTIISP